MTALQEVEALIARLNRAEKAQLLRSVVRDLGDDFPGIGSMPGVSGGEPCIVQARRLGVSEADLLRAYPTLRAEDLVNAWAYERAHRDEIDAQIAENEAA